MPVTVVIIASKLLLAVNALYAIILHVVTLEVLFFLAIIHILFRTVIAHIGL